ncbi:hypothetical protein OROMI_007232 [Orobanche minor]
MRRFSSLELVGIVVLHSTRSCRFIFGDETPKPRALPGHFSSCGQRASSTRL